MPRGPGAHYREADGSPVALPEAEAAWALVARAVLIETAQAKRSISYKALAEAVQQGAGIRTRMLFRWWVGDVLTLVGDECERRGEPQLAALCVRQDGSIGAGFGEGESSADREVRAGEERERCYRHFGP
ncbi:MAG: hypothetical protein QOG03_2669 [Actinomycetota bacterium]|jgi:hypothetical protein|nr:hypothetical protein [Actinomycetota bacterium]